MGLGFTGAVPLENGCCTLWLPCYQSLVNVFGEVEGDVQPLHLSPTQMLGEAEADEHIPCVFVWRASGVQGFFLFFLLRGHFLSDE